MAEKIALFGGTFDPIHSGHIQLALGFARRLGLDQVLLMPTFVPPHKLKPDMASAEDRLAMCRLAAQADPVLHVSDLEIARGGASFTADTLEALRAQHPGAQLYLITGADMFLTLGTWWRFSDITAMAVLCAAPRGGVTIGELRHYAAQLEAAGARCVVEDIQAMDISSTQIRDLLRRGEPVGDTLPGPVAAYIAQKGLYRQANSGQAWDMEDQFVEILRGRLTSKRFRHSLAVAEEAERLARQVGADPRKARIAGLLHDILRCADGDAQLQILRDFDILLDNVERQAPALWHARAGAVFIEKVLGVTDPEIVAAVRYHTTARGGMSLLEKVLYMADITSADRTYPDVEETRRRVGISLDEGMLYALDYSIRESLDKKRAIHPDTLAAYNELVLGPSGPA